MYDELIKELREHAAKQCPMEEAYGMCGCINARKAADAIEELQQQVEHYHDCMNDWFEAAQEYEAAVPKWIPVTERLPEKNGSYLVYVYGEVTEMDCWHGKWHRLRDDYTKAVTHWMPLPQAPKEGK